MILLFGRTMSLDSILPREMLLVLVFLLSTSYLSEVSASSDTSDNPESHELQGVRRSSDGGSSRFLSSLAAGAVPGIITVDEDGSNIGDIIVLGEDDSQKSGKRPGMDVISIPHQQHHYPPSMPPFGVRFGSSPPSTQSSPPGPTSSDSGEQDNESIESPFDMDSMSTQEAEKYMQAASHHHAGGGGGGGHHGWLDMGAYSGKHGSFGWYADFPVGGGHAGYGHGRRR